MIKVCTQNVGVVMKYYLVSIFSLISFSALAGINPFTVQTQLYSIFEENTRNANELFYETTGFFQYWDAEKGKGILREDKKQKQKVPVALFEAQQKLARSVFTTKQTYDLPNQASSLERSYMEEAGTAFLVGQDLVLTNEHVLVYSKVKGCGNFSIKTNPIPLELANSLPFPVAAKKSFSFSCDKVLFCDYDNDFCLIKMKKIKMKYKDHGRKKKIQVSLGDLFSPLSLDIRGVSQSGETFSSISNALSKGIQGSAATGLSESTRLITRQGDTQATQATTHYFHTVPIFKGSSGSPLFDSNGIVVGINKACNQARCYGPQCINLATPTYIIYNILNEQLSDQDFAQINWRY